jgi:hypothetical protein
MGWSDASHNPTTNLRRRRLPENLLVAVSFGLDGWLDPSAARYSKKLF